MAEQERLRIDPNTADANALTQLPGIGPVLARRIVEARPYERVGDLVRVQGIGEETLERLRPSLALSEGGEAFSLPERGGSEPPEEIGPATSPVVAVAPETTYVPASEPEEPVEGLPVKERERAMDASEAEAPEAEVIAEEGMEAEAEVVEGEVVEAEVTEAEAAEADASGPADAETEASATEVIEAKVDQAEEDAEEVGGAEVVEAEIVRSEDAEEDAASWEREPIPGFGQEEPLEEVAPQPQRPAVTRARVRWTALLSIVLATLLGALLSLAILSYVNGGQLQYVTPARFGELSTRAEGLEAQADVLAQDVEGLRRRLDNLEALSGRLNALEQATEGVQADLEATAGEIAGLVAQTSDLESQAAALESEAAELAQQAEEVEGRVDTLEAQGSRAEAFLEGLAELMDTLFPTEEGTQ